MKEELGLSKLQQCVLLEGQAKPTVSVLEVKRKMRHKVIRAIVILFFYSHNSIFCYWLLLCSAARHVQLHEDLKMVYRVFLESGEGCSTCHCCRSSCGGLRHGGNKL